jgi:heme/copper-type cytochrome/quinol oxidase subunit 3
MTGLHALHLLIGIGAVVAMVLHTALGQPNLEIKIRIIGLYWHFIDVVWVFLFSALYLAARHG